MRSSQLISLFSDRPEPGRRSLSIFFSILAHGAVIGVVAYVIVNTPEIRGRVVTERFDMRHLDLHMPDPKEWQSSASSIQYPGPHDAAHNHSSGGSLAALRQMVQAQLGPQTLLQPDITNPIHLKEKIPVPTVMIWTAKKTAVKLLVAPKLEPPKMANVRPMPDAPNQEKNLADLSITSTSLAAQAHAILPSTTSPVVVHGPEQVQAPPVTSSVSTAQPTPTAVVSLSDLQMRNGTVTLPPINETVAVNSPGALESGSAVDPLRAGAGNSASTANGMGAGQGSGNAGNGAAGNSNADKAGAGQGSGNAGNGNAGKSNGGKSGTGKEANASAGSGSGMGDQPATVKITLPKDGHFGAVVVGASLGEEYPDAAKLWSGRIAYTVYLHVGTAKSWILQFSLPRTEDASSAGNLSHLDAPWPYNIVRPNLSPDALNADALMIHGYVNQAGRFELLAVTFPPQFDQAQFVLDALEQWQFRPAVRNGQNAKVEVLLIIPEDSE